MATKASQKRSGKIAAFISSYSNTATGYNYKHGVESFLRCINNLPKKDQEGRKPAFYDYEKLFDAYLADKRRDHDKDFQKFADQLKTECVSLQSARQIMTYARRVLEDNGVQIKGKMIRDLKRELKGGAGTVDKVLTPKVIDAALKELDIKGRAIVLTLASSGMRLNEALGVSLSDIDMQATPVKIVVRNTKNKQTRYTFISTEAARCVQEWLAKRDEYLAGAAGRNAGLVRAGKSAEKSATSDLLFPVSDNAVNAMWENALREAGLFSVDSQTGRNQYRLHSFRKFFISQLAMAGMKTLAEHLAGHEGYLDASYRRIDEEQEGIEYRKVEHVVTIGIPPEFREKAAELSGKLQLQGEGIEGLRIMNEKLAAQMASLQQANTTLKDENTALQERSLKVEQALDKQKSNLDLMVDLWGMAATEAAERAKDPRRAKEVQDLLAEYHANPSSTV